MWLLKLPLKLLCLPLLAVLGVLFGLGRLAAGLSACVVWLLFAVLVLAGAWCAACGLWTSLLILADCFLAVLALWLSGVLAVEVTGNLSAGLVRFLRS